MKWENIGMFPGVIKIVRNTQSQLYSFRAAVKQNSFICMEMVENKEEIEDIISQMYTFN